MLTTAAIIIHPNHMYHCRMLNPMLQVWKEEELDSKHGNPSAPSAAPVASRLPEEENITHVVPAMSSQNETFK